VIYSGWMLFHSEYVYVIADTGARLAAIAALHGWSAIRARDRASPWILLGVGVSALAAAAQASGFAPHRHFNNNDLYHVIQIAAMLLFTRREALIEFSDPLRERRPPWRAVTKS